MLIQHSIAKSVGLAAVGAGGASAMLANATTDPVALELASKFGEGSVLLVILFFFFKYHERQMDLKQSDSDKHFGLALEAKEHLIEFVEQQKELNGAIRSVGTKIDSIGSKVERLVEQHEKDK